VQTPSEPLGWRERIVLKLLFWLVRGMHRCRCEPPYRKPVKVPKLYWRCDWCDGWIALPKEIEDKVRVYRR
jgi:hypothetical protein